MTFFETLALVLLAFVALIFSVILGVAIVDDFE